MLVTQNQWLLAWKCSSLSQEKFGITQPHTSRRFPVDGKRLQIIISNHFSSESDDRSSVFITHAENRQSRSGGRSGGRRGKHLGIGKLPGNTVRKKKTPEPYTRHEDEYYKFGRHGPYSYKAPVVGTLKPVTTLTTHHVFTWSTVRDIKEQEEINIHNACVAYDNRVRTFDESVGLQFFYVFVRLPFKAIEEPPWKQWSLVSEITIESGESLDKLMLHSRLSNIVKNMITQHTGWFRPDLIFVKRPGYQVRFEPEMEFLGELRKLLLESAGEVYEKDSYYGGFCKILGVDVDASHEEITSKFEESPDTIRLACLEHLFTNHPVELFYHYPYPNRKIWIQREFPNSKSSVVEVEAPRSAEEDAHIVNEKEELTEDNYDDGYSESDQEDDTEETTENWEDTDDNDDDLGSDMGMQNRIDSLEYEESILYADNSSEDKGVQIAEDLEDEGVQIPEDHEDSGGEAMPLKPFLKAAVRPYTYVNFIRETVMLRHTLLQRKMMSSV